MGVLSGLLHLHHFLQLIADETERLPGFSPSLLSPPHRLGPGLTSARWYLGTGGDQNTGVRLCRSVDGNRYPYFLSPPSIQLYLFIAEYAEAASSPSGDDGVRFQPLFRTPYPPLLSISNVLLLSSLCYLSIRVSFFQLKPTPTDIPPLPPFSLLFFHLILY